MTDDYSLEDKGADFNTALRPTPDARDEEPDRTSRPFS
jgi:hypothetical protein